MGLFGGNKSSSKTTNIAQDITKSYGDYSEVDGSQTKLITDLQDVSLTNGSALNLSVLDGGAIDASYDFAGKNLDALVTLYDNAMQDIDASSQRETSTAMAALNKATTLSAGDLLSSDAVKYIGLGILAIFAFKYLGAK